MSWERTGLLSTTGSVGREFSSMLFVRFSPSLDEFLPRMVSWCRGLSQLLLRHLVGVLVLLVVCPHSSCLKACQSVPATLSPRCQWQVGVGPTPTETSLAFLCRVTCISS